MQNLFCITAIFPMHDERRQYLQSAGSSTYHSFNQHHIRCLAGFRLNHLQPLGFHLMLVEAHDNFPQPFRQMNHGKPATKAQGKTGRPYHVTQRRRKLMAGASHS